MNCCSKPKCVEQQSISTRPVLVTAEVFNRGRYGTSDSVKDDYDYLDMEDPPNFDDFMYLRYDEETFRRLFIVIIH